MLPNIIRLPVLKANKLFKRTFSWYLKNFVYEYIQSFACKYSVDEEIVQVAIECGVSDKARNMQFRVAG